MQMTRKSANAAGRVTRGASSSGSPFFRELRAIGTRDMARSLPTIFCAPYLLAIQTRAPAVLDGGYRRPRAPAATKGLSRGDVALRVRLDERTVAAVSERLRR
jgi:hypothetical protein